ncbi:MAG: hypothetical protein VKM34_00370 [Cyanobacteriota bacterium]|nr:hypothetical protein [Cyanobacteriota bacterium]
MPARGHLDGLGSEGSPLELIGWLGGYLNLLNANFSVSLLREHQDEGATMFCQGSHVTAACFGLNGDDRSDGVGCGFSWPFDGFFWRLNRLWMADIHQNAALVPAVQD